MSYHISAVRATQKLCIVPYLVGYPRVQGTPYTRTVRTRLVHSACTTSRPSVPARDVGQSGSRDGALRWLYYTALSGLLTGADSFEEQRQTTKPYSIQQQMAFVQTLTLGAQALRRCAGACTRSSASRRFSASGAGGASSEAVSSTTCSAATTRNRYIPFWFG